jgi:hypothetical protein
MQREEVIEKLRARAKLFAFEDKAIGIYADREVEKLLLTAAALIEESHDVPRHVQDLHPVQIRLVP